MNVLSLFDGCACTYQALKNLNLKVNKYYAAEIDKYAQIIAKKNHPDIISLGDVTKWNNWNIDFSNINLLVAGFPCQSWSVAGKRKGIEDKRGQLLYYLLDIKNEILKVNPDLKFIFENVFGSKKNKAFLDNLIGVESVLINSNTVSAQNRKRLYWCNFKVTQPEDRKIYLKDIIHETKDMGKVLSEFIVPFKKTLKILDKEVERGKVGYFRKDSQANRVYYIHDKAVTLCGEAGGGAAKMGQYLFGCITPDRINKGQNGQRFNSGTKFYTLTAQDQHGILIEGYIRRLTPIECERLQTLPDNYTYHPNVSNTQRYKMLGNGFTVRVIEHLMKCNFNAAQPDDREYCLDYNYFKGTNVSRYFCKNRRQIVWVIPEATKKGYIEIISGELVDLTFIKSLTRRGRRMVKKSNCLTATEFKYCKATEDWFRKLTPIECERLQTLPDNYTYHPNVSNTQRYKMLGNGFTVRVIEHLIKERGVEE